MTYDLILGDYAYSSWSLRGWLLFDRFGISCNCQTISFDDGPVASQIAQLAPARTVPALRTPEGAILWDSLAIAEELASRHPDARLWPDDQSARATARSLAAEMHAGFSALRSECPMTLRQAYTGVSPSDQVIADLRRLETIWNHARRTGPSQSPWLLGDYCIADVFFAPVAARIAGYGLAVNTDAQAYVAAHLNDPAFRRWRAMALVHGPDLTRYSQDHAVTEWPGPAPLPARAVAHGPSENSTCPYSGKSPTSLLEMQGRIFGFCNPFCRDKTVADPEAWPDFMSLIAREASAAH